MNNDLRTKILMFIVGMLQRIYIGAPAILFLLIGIVSPTCKTIGFILLILWIVVSMIGYITTMSIIENDPVVRETINSIVANENLGNHTFQDGQEIEFSDIPEENVKLVGRCFNSKENIWVMRLLYEGSYQIFDWKLKVGPSAKPELISISKMEGHENEYLVKGYEQDTDGRVRAQLYWLKRNGAIYKDYRLDLPKVIEQIMALYHIEWDKDNKTVHYIEKDETKEDVKDIPIVVADMGKEPLNMVFGNTVYYDLDQMKIFLSVGENYENYGSVEHAKHHIVAKMKLTDDGIGVSDFRFEIQE